MRLEFRIKETEKKKKKKKEREREKRLSLDKGGKFLKTLGLVVLFCGKKQTCVFILYIYIYIYNFYFKNIIYIWIKQFENQLESDPIF